MFKPVFSIICLLLANLSIAQTYEEAINQCTTAYQSGLNFTDKEGLESRMREENEKLTACLIGLPFPPFSATTMDGSTVSGKDLKGKVILINLWYISCPPALRKFRSSMIFGVNSKKKKYSF